jgi:hypothetical protein
MLPPETLTKDARRTAERQSRPKPLKPGSLACVDQRTTSRKHDSRNTAQVGVPGHGSLFCNAGPSCNEEQHNIRTIALQTTYEFEASASGPQEPDHEPWRGVPRLRRVKKIELEPGGELRLQERATRCDVAPEYPMILGWECPDEEEPLSKSDQAT